MKFAAFFIALLLGVSACGSSSAKSLNGTWHEGTSFVAQVTNNKIRIDIVDEGDATLYWKGTFRSSVPNGTAIVSKGDKKAMDASILGSMDSTKKFTYANNRLVFKFSILGQTRTIHLRRA